MQLVELQRSPQFASGEAARFAISFDLVAILQAFASRYGITYPLLSDEGSLVIRRLGLLNEQLEQQHAHCGVRHLDKY